MENKSHQVLHSQKEDDRGVGKIKIITYKAGTKEKLREDTVWTPNMVMDGTYTGKQILLAILANDAGYSGTGHITYGELGTGTTAVATSDVALQTPVARAPISQVLTSGDTKSFQFFFVDAILANGTYTEFGSFTDGSITIGTGKIFNHALFLVPYTKASGTDVTVQFDYTLT